MLKNILIGSLVLSPVIAAVYLTSSDPMQRSLDEKRLKEKTNKDVWIPKNLNLYLEGGITAPKCLPGSHFEYSIDYPEGPVTSGMKEAATDIDRLYILADYERNRDQTTHDLWRDFVRPRSEMTVRSVDQPITQVHILQRGGLSDDLIKTGSRFWDAPYPSFWNTDRYYPRKEQIPWYLTP